MVGALRILETAVDQFAGTESARRAQEGGSRGSKARRRAREAYRVLAKEKRGLEAFEAGQAAEKAKDYLSARKEYQRAATLASGTPLADKATARIEVLAKDPDIKPLFDRADRDSKAQADLKAADALLADGKKEEARAAFKKIVEQHAGTAAAAAAKAKLEDLR